MDQKLIEKWLSEQLITKKQATIMLSDISESKKENSSNKFIIALSTIGALLLGIGAMIFISANWQVMNSFSKIAIMFFSALISYAGGYYLKFETEKLPKVGSALLFLSSILFGVSLMVVAQIYHSNANAHWLVLIWILAIIPMVYAFVSPSIAGIVIVLFYVWTSLFFNEINQEEYFPGIILLVSLIIFLIGNIHYINRKFDSIARIYRIFSLKIIMFLLFLYTFNDFSRKGWFMAGYNPSNTFIILYGLVILFGISLFIFNPSKEKSTKIESLTAGIIGTFFIVYMYTTSYDYIFSIIFNLLLASLIILLIYQGYEYEEIKMVNIGIFWAGVLIIARYFDFFWDRLPTSIFFIIGGGILVFGGIYLEKTRRNLKQKFGAEK